jgi:hypothetical protein
MQVGHRDRYQRTLEALQTDRENRRRYRAVRAATVHEYAGLVHDWFKYTLIWKKNKSTQFLLANYRPMKCTEDICVFSRGGAALHHGQPEI